MPPIPNDTDEQVNHKPTLLSRECLDAMVRAAVRLVEEVGLEADHDDLLRRAAACEGLAVRDRRVFVSSELAFEVLQRMRSAGQTEEEPTPESPLIRVSARAMLMADHVQRKLLPLTRADVVSGTRLIDALADRGVQSHACGSPQEIPFPLQPIEQYVIGYRYSRHGGWTDMVVGDELGELLLQIRETAEDGFDRKRQHLDIWLPSPMKLSGDSLDFLFRKDEGIASFCVGSMPLMGLNGPVTPLGVYTLSLAESFGAAAVVSQMFPGATPAICPHPQPMDLHGGRIAFGTVEWNRLDLMKKEILNHLGLPYRKKTNLTSSCMPDAVAQADKMASISFGVAHGFTEFVLYPLCADEAWSPVQCVLDVEYVHTAWATGRIVTETSNAEEAVEVVRRSIEEDILPAEMEQTVRRLRENYFASMLPRVFSSGGWQSDGRPDPVSDAQARADELIARADYAPPNDRLRKVMRLYEKACRLVGAEPLGLD